MQLGASAASRQSEPIGFCFDAHGSTDHGLTLGAVPRLRQSGPPLAGREFSEADWLSIDGESGEISSGRADIVIERPEAEFAELKRWFEQADKLDRKAASGGAAP